MKRSQVYIYYNTKSSYCLKCRANTKSKNPKVSKTNNEKMILLSVCLLCNSKQPRFIREQEASGILSELGIRSVLSKVPLLGDTLF